MLGFLYLISMSAAGLVAIQRFMPRTPAIVKLAGAFLLGLIVSAWVTYAFAYALHSLTDESLMIGIFAALVLHGIVIGAWARGMHWRDFRLTGFEIAFIGLSLLFSFWLLDNRLEIDRSQPDNPLVVSGETWGDTGLHVGLSRTFSEGTNYPTSFLYYANEPIHYHFGYDFFAGALQKGGMSVLLSFNLPGAIGFAAMMVLLLAIGRTLFTGWGVEEGYKRSGPPWFRDRGVWIGMIAAALLMTNQSLAFLRWIDRNGGVWEALKPDNWWNHQGYLTIGPYDANEKIAIFNTLNVFLTQTHLIVGVAAVLFVGYGLLQPLRKGVSLPPGRMALLGVMVGFSFWLNGVLYVAAGVFFGSLIVIFAVAGAYRHAEAAEPEERLSAFGNELWRWTKMSLWFIVPAVGFAAPQALWLSDGETSENLHLFHFGYLVCSAAESSCRANGDMDLLNLSHWGEFFEYWWLNNGLMLPLLGLAAIIASRFEKKVLAAVMAVFIFGSIAYLSRDLGGHNHKTFNLWEILAGLFVGYALVEMWNLGRTQLAKSSLTFRALVQPLAWIVVPVAIFFLVVSGLLDFMTIKNDNKFRVFGDPTTEVAIDWVADNTPPDSVFLTDCCGSETIYTVPTLAGRTIFLGYATMVGGAGYDLPTREEIMRNIYQSQTREAACALLTENEIDYVLIGGTERSGQRFALNEQLFIDQFTLVQAFPEGGSQYTVYEVESSCGPAAVRGR